MFLARPVRQAVEDTSGQAGIRDEFVGPLEALPVPEEEDEEDEDPQAIAGLPQPGEPPRPLALPALPQVMPASTIAGPETGGGPSYPMSSGAATSSYSRPLVFGPAPPQLQRPNASVGNFVGRTRPPQLQLPGPKRGNPTVFSIGNARPHGPATAWEQEAPNSVDWLPNSQAIAVPKPPAAPPHAALGEPGALPAPPPPPNRELEALPGTAADQTVHEVMPPLPDGPRPGQQVDAIALTRSVPDGLMPLPGGGADDEVLQSQTQAALLRRVRRMYVEKVMENSERVAWDERVDMKSRIGHPMAQAASALVHTAVTCYWITALALTVTYAARFGHNTAIRWAYSCIAGWLFLGLILEVVRNTLTTILELSQLNQRRRLQDHLRLKDRVALKKALKKKQMVDLVKMPGIVPAPEPRPARPPPPLPADPPPALGDDAAG